jgi:hypothetical protein
MERDKPQPTEILGKMYQTQQNPTDLVSMETPHEFKASTKELLTFAFISPTKVGYRIVALPTCRRAGRVEAAGRMPPDSLCACSRWCLGESLDGIWLSGQQERKGECGCSSSPLHHGHGDGVCAMGSSLARKELLSPARTEATTS